MIRSPLVATALLAAAALSSCSKKGDEPTGSNAGAIELPPAPPSGPNEPAVKRKIDPVAPPAGIDIKAPPADAEHTASGLVFKSLAEGSGTPPQRNDTVSVQYTAWHQNGETMYSSKARGKPVPMQLANQAPGLVEAITKIKPGGSAIFWVPPAIGFRGTMKSEAETLAFEVQLTDVRPAPAIPPDVAAAPATAQKTGKGAAFIVVKPGTGTAKARGFDTATFKYTAWDTSGRQLDTTEGKTPRTGMPLKEQPGLEDALTQMTVGERARFWIPRELVKGSPDAAPGPLCFEIELVDLRAAARVPPPAPADVAAPPKDAKKTAAGVFYKVLKEPSGTEHPAPTDSVKVEYTGWTTDGRLFDSSFLKPQPAEFPLGGVIKGWTDGLQVMSPGETARFWIPVELAYNHQPGKPDGMLVFDIQLISISHGPPTPPTPPAPSMHGHP